MRIRKEYQVIPTNAKLENGDSTSATNGYVADYINNHSVVVSAVEPSGSARKKVWKRHSKNLLNKDVWQGAYIDTTGLIIPANNNALFRYIEVKPNTSYSINTKSNVYVFAVTEFDRTGTFIQRTGSSSNVKTFTFTTRETTYFVRVVINYNPSTTITQEIIDSLEIMVNESSTALPYEPYVEDETFILNDNDDYEEFNDNKGVILYEDIKGTNSTITLSENISNYKSVEVFYFLNDITNMKESKKSDIFGTTYIPMEIIWGGTDNKLYIASARVTISGTSITFDNRNVNFIIDTNGIVSTSYTIKVYKVIGYK